MASEVVYLNGERFRSSIARLLWNCDDLRRYLANNVDALINYGARYRSKLPISTSRAERCVDEIANSRMAKKAANAMVSLGSALRRDSSRGSAGRPVQDRNRSSPGSLIDQNFSTPIRPAWPLWA
jgi:hypothetical protein